MCGYSAFNQTWSDQSHAEWLANFRAQNPTARSRVKMEVILRSGEVAWVNDGAEGDFTATGQAMHRFALMPKNLHEFQHACRRSCRPVQVHIKINQNQKQKTQQMACMKNDLTPRKFRIWG